MRIKIIELLACMLLLSNTIEALNLSRYCCCLEIFKNRKSRESFASTESNENDGYRCMEEIFDGQTVITFIEKPTKQAALSTTNLTNENNSQSRNCNAKKNNYFGYHFTQHSSMGIHFAGRYK